MKLMMDPNNITATLMHQQSQRAETYKQLVRKQKLNRLAKRAQRLSCAVRTFLHSTMILCF